MTWCNLFRGLVEESLALQFPKQLSIHNTRLGILLRCQQITALIFIVWFTLAHNAWVHISKPKGHGLTLWREDPDPLKTADTGVSHCQAVQTYWFSRSSSWKYEPTSCRALPAYEVANRGADSFTFATLVQDSTVLSRPERCGEAERQHCTWNVTGGIYTENGNECSCTVREQYFVRNPEENRIVFVHGYRLEEEGDGANNEESETVSSGVVTLITGPGGSGLCTVSGKSRWSAAESLTGIGGTLKEWLACAGISMDSDPRKLTGGGEGLAPHLRTMGFAAEIRLQYLNNHGMDETEKVVCLVTVHVTPVWTIRESTDFTQFAALSEGSQQSMRIRSASGVIVTLKVSGEIRTFSIERLVSFVVQALVLLQIPFFVTQFVAMHGLGFMSEIYRKAKCSQLNVFTMFYSAITRMIMAEMGFRGLVGDFTGSMSSLQGIDKRCLYNHLCDVFHDEISDGILQTHEVKKMALATFAHLDSNQSGFVSCPEFIKGLTAEESISLLNAAKFFDEDQETGLVQRVLDDSRQRRHSIVAAFAVEASKDEDAEEQACSQLSDAQQQDTTVLCMTARGQSVDSTSHMAYPPTVATPSLTPSPTPSHTPSPTPPPTPPPQDSLGDREILQRVAQLEVARKQLDHRLSVLEETRRDNQTDPKSRDRSLTEEDSKQLATSVAARVHKLVEATCLQRLKVEAERIEKDLDKRTKELCQLLEKHCDETETKLSMESLSRSAAAAADAPFVETAYHEPPRSAAGSVVPSRANSVVNSRVNSRINSHANSRANSVVNSAVNSRMNSRANSQAGSCGNSPREQEGLDSGHAKGEQPVVYRDRRPWSARSDEKEQQLTPSTSSSYSSAQHMRAESVGRAGLAGLAAGAGVGAIKPRDQTENSVNTSEWSKRFNDARAERSFAPKTPRAGPVPAAPLTARGHERQVYSSWGAHVDATRERSTVGTKRSPPNPFFDAMPDRSDSVETPDSPMPEVKVWHPFSSSRD